METILAILVGVMVAGAIYLMLDRILIRFILGLVLMSNAVNLLIFTVGRLPSRRPPCFFDQRHGLSVTDAQWAPQDGAIRDVPVCAACDARIKDGLDPEARLVPRRAATGPTTTRARSTGRGRAAGTARPACT